MSQSQFAALLGVSVRTLQGWEQGRKQPSGAARTLLAIANANPKALLAVAGKQAVQIPNNGSTGRAFGAPATLGVRPQRTASTHFINFIRSKL